VRGPPNEDFGLPPGRDGEGRFESRDGSDDEAAGLVPAAVENMVKK